VWQRDWLEAGTLERQLDYWREQLAGLEPVELPTDFATPKTQNHEGGLLKAAAGGTLLSGMRELARREGVTLSIIALSALQVLLAQFYGSDNFTIGIDVAGRNHAMLEPLIGSFVNQLVFRNTARASEPFTETLRKARTLMLDAYAHQDVPYESVAAELERDSNSGTLRPFDVKLVFQPAISQEISLSLSGLRLSHETAVHRTSKLPLTWFLLEAEDEVRVLLEYDTNLFRQSTPQHLLGRFQDLLSEIVRDPGAVLYHLPAVPDEALIALSATLEV
jgi:non-ribosomal peptide synthetase component F